jgi:hypothetical protein
MPADSAHSRHHNWTETAHTARGENRMNTPKSTATPQRKERSAFQSN